MSDSFCRWAVVALFVLLHPEARAIAQTLPAPFEAEYAGRRFPLSANARISLQRYGDYYRYVMHGSVRMAFFEVAETYDCSVLAIRDGELYPLEYVHRDGRERDRDLHTRFDWDRRTAHIRRGDGSVAAVEGLPSIAWDIWSLQVRLRADAPALAPGAEREYAVIEKGALKHHRARRGGVEVTEVRGEATRAAKLVAESPRRASALWFAPEYAWLPVRIAVGDVTLDLASDPAAAARPALPAAPGVPACE